MEDIKRVVGMGFLFGILFSLIAYLGNFHIEMMFLLMMPFFIAGLCVLGTVVGGFTTNILIGKGYTNAKINLGISYLTAALVNGAIVIIFLAFMGITYVQREAVLGSVVGLSMGAIYGLYRFQVEKMNEKMVILEALSEKNKELQEASRRLAIIEERNRMGRELHDTVSQGLHGLVFSLHSLRNEWTCPTQRVSEILDHMEATANASLSELKTMIEELKPSLLMEAGLEKALKVTVNLFSQRTNIMVDISILMPVSLPPDVEMAIYRISQEALANIEKHAKAENVSLEINSNPEHLLVNIRDDGIGFMKRKFSQGNGLENIRQRVEDAGGILDIISKPGIGTTIIVKFPQSAE